MNAAVKPTCLIFDLDGTLIDSSFSILAGLSASLSAHNICPTQPLRPDVIGPPLRQTLSMLSGSSDPDLLSSLCSAFMRHYDSEGYKATAPFPEVERMLRSAHALGIPLHIATNKRLIPTQLILEHLGWQSLFTSVFALDKAIPAYANKAQMLAAQLIEQDISPMCAAYIGDRQEDGIAADENGMKFMAALWGYGNNLASASKAHWLTLASPAALKNMLLTHA